MNHKSDESLHQLNHKSDESLNHENDEQQHHELGFSSPPNSS